MANELAFVFDFQFFHFLFNFFAQGFRQRKTHNATHMIVFKYRYLTLTVLQCNTILPQKKIPVKKIMHTAFFV
jgi:hypothetical protein